LDAWLLFSARVRIRLPSPSSRVTFFLSSAGVHHDRSDLFQIWIALFPFPVKRTPLLLHFFPSLELPEPNYLHFSSAAPAPLCTFIPSCPGHTVLLPLAASLFFPARFSRVILHRRLDFPPPALVPPLIFSAIQAATRASRPRPILARCDRPFFFPDGA